MKIVEIPEARRTLSKLLDRVAAGEEIVIGRAGKPVVRMIPLKKPADQAPAIAKGKKREAKG